MAREDHQTPVGVRSRTKQANRNETDINLMIARYRKTGQVPTNSREPKYGDFSEAITLEDAFQRVKEANESFMALPSRVRALAMNNPITLLEMLADEDDTAALVQAGLPVNIPPPNNAGPGGLPGGEGDKTPTTIPVGSSSGGGVSQTN